MTKPVIFVRHFEDLSKIKTYGFDSPLKEYDLDNTTINTAVKTILEAVQNLRINSIRIVHSKQRRAVESAHIFKKKIETKYSVFLQEEDLLSDFSQGVVALNYEYHDGEELSILKEAWQDFEERAYSKKDTKYKFGESFGEGFNKAGDSLLTYLNRNYIFFENILSDVYQNDEELLVICCHSTTILLLLELEYIVNSKTEYTLGINPEELPFVCWGIYKEKIKPLFPNGIDFGQAFLFSFPVSKYSNIKGILQKARKIIIN